MTEQAAAAAGGLEQVRDLLFGTHIRQIDKRFAEMEHALQGSLSRLSADLERRLAALEAFTKQQIAALSEALQAERKETVAQAQALERQLGARIDELGSSAGTKLRDAQQALAERAEAAAKHTQQQLDELRESIARETRALGDGKLDRAALVQILAEVAGRLDGEPKAARKGRG